MPEAMCAANGIELCHEEFGDPADPAVLLVMGLATQMLGWHADFCAALAARGFHVIRYDNRDVGRSTHMTGAPPTLRQLVVRSKKAARYALDDMAADGVGLLDALGIERAHVVGASMGGMIAQTIAARYPDRTLSLTSIMSNTGGRLSGQPTLRVLPLFLRKPPRGRDAYIERTVELFGVIGSPGFARDEAELREMLAHGWERGHDAAGPGRQLAAVLAATHRRKLLATIRVPALVIHGTDDPLVRPSGGRATARAIPGARLLLIEGMGHDLPRGAWPQILDGIEETARRASPVRASAVQPDFPAAGFSLARWG
ncbi:MAG: alpha/beta fold hydrolase [Solirubrobacteraceae bacterium]